MTDLKEQALKRVAAAEAEAERMMKNAAPWEKAAFRHAERIMHLENAHNAAKAAMSATAKARGQAFGELRVHEEKLTTVDLSDISEWAIEARRLTGVLEALAERHRLEGVKEEHAKRQLKSAQSEDPAAATKASYLRSLRNVMMSDTASDTEKWDAYRELNRIMDSDKPRIQEFVPPGFDPKKYVRGMLKNPG